MSTEFVPEKNKWVESRSSDIFWPERRDAIRHGYCSVCKATVNVLNSRLSLDEYYISGMCQECQDKVFGSSEE